MRLIEEFLGLIGRLSRDNPDEREEQEGAAVRKCHRFVMDPDVMADELAVLIQSMGKGPYLVFCAALRAAGGEVTINPDELARDALRLPPRVEVSPNGQGQLVVRLMA